jgi:sugar phosphate isomerase/epimerase
LQKATLPELIEAAGRHGFPTLSIRPHSVLNAFNDGLSEASLRQRLRDAGVRVQVVDALSPSLPGEDPTPMKDTSGRPMTRVDEASCFRIAEAVSAPTINVTLTRGEPRPVGELIEVIGGVSARAAAHGLSIVLEFVPGSNMHDIHSARAIAEGVGAPNCRILLDPWHLSRSGGSLEDVKALAPGAIGAFQLCDRTPPPPGVAYVPMSGRDLPGEGRLPLHDIARAALANNPKLTVEIEVFSQELRELSVDGAAARTAEAIRLWRAGL